MTSVAFTVPVLGLFLLQAPERAKEARQPSQTFDLAQTAPQPPSPTVPGEKAFGKLFEQAQERAARQAVANQKPATRIVCGMVVIQADPNIDPKFVIRAPVDSSTMKIRRIPPATCAE